LCEHIAEPTEKNPAPQHEPFAMMVIHYRATKRFTLERLGRKNIWQSVVNILANFCTSGGNNLNLQLRDSLTLQTTMFSSGQTKHEQVKNPAEC
jgi:hypothetical protein